jgi:hypothetical protein
MNILITKELEGSNSRATLIAVVIKESRLTRYRNEAQFHLTRGRGA